MKYYAQNNEDKIIYEYFNGFVGTLLSLGENDGVTLSNSRLLIESGWSGCLVEASPKTFKKLDALYKDNPNVDCVNVGVGDKNEKLYLHDSGEHLGTGDESLVSTFDERELLRWKNNTNFVKTVVDCVDYKTLLDKTQFNRFDFITIDIEGFEPLVLPQIDLSATKLICIEWNSKPELAGMFKNYIEQFGLKEIARNNENLIFAK